MKYYRYYMNGLEVNDPQESHGLVHERFLRNLLSNLPLYNLLCRSNLKPQLQRNTRIDLY